MTKLIKLATFSAVACALSLSAASAATTVGEPAAQSSDERIILAQSNRRVDVYGGMQTDVYSSRSTAQSMLRSIVGNRLAAECQSQYNSSLLWDTISYLEFWDGTTGAGRYRASTSQATGYCR